jgi:hypothetical protein
MRRERYKAEWHRLRWLRRRAHECAMLDLWGAGRAYMDAYKLLADRQPFRAVLRADALPVWAVPLADRLCAYQDDKLIPF